MAESADSTSAIDSGPSSSVPLPETLLKLKKCLIRRHHDSDAEAMAKGANNPNVAKGMSDAWPQPYTPNDARTWMSSTSSGSPPFGFVICRIEDNVAIGSIGVSEKREGDPTTMQAGYWLSEDQWGKGIATEMVAAMTQWCFQNIRGMDCMEIEAYARNGASCRVLEKAGFVFQETRVGAVRKDGEDLDMLVYHKRKS